MNPMKSNISLPEGTFELDAAALRRGQLVIDRGGQRITLALTPADVHFPAELDTYLAGFKPAQFRADLVSPPILVDNDQGWGRTFSANDAFLLVDPRTSISSPPNEIDPSSALAAYAVGDRCLGSFVSTQTDSQSGNAYNPRMAAGRRCKNGLLLWREVEILTTFVGTAGSWAAANRIALVGGQEWGLTAGGYGVNSDPIKNLQNAMEASAQPVTGFWMNRLIANAFLRHPSVKDTMRQMLGDSPLSSAMAASIASTGSTAADFQIPGLPPIHISDVQYALTLGGARVYALPNVCVAICTPPTPPTNGEEIASTYTFRRKGPSGTGIETREYEVPGRGTLGGTMVAVTMADAPLMTGNTCGAIITGVYL